MVQTSLVVRVDWLVRHFRRALKGALLFTHTEVVPQFEGKGLAGRLIAFALDDVRRRGLLAIPVCPFVAAYIREHPEYLDLLSEESRRAFLR